MSGFQFRLQALLRVRQLERDECQLQLAQELRAEQLLAEQATDLLRCREEVRQQSRHLSQPGEIIVDDLRTARRYVSRLDIQLEAIRIREVRIKEEVGRQRDRLVDADREVLMLEKLRDRRAEEYRRNQTVLENKAIDESAAHGNFRQENALWHDSAR